MTLFTIIYFILDIISIKSQLKLLSKIFPPLRSISYSSSIPVNFRWQYVVVAGCRGELVNRCRECIIGMVSGPWTVTCSNVRLRAFIHILARFTSIISECRIDTFMELARTETVCLYFIRPELCFNGFHQVLLIYTDNMYTVQCFDYTASVNDDILTKFIRPFVSHNCLNNYSTLHCSVRYSVALSSVVQLYTVERNVVDIYTCRSCTYDYKKWQKNIYYNKSWEKLQ